MKCLTRESFSERRWSGWATWLTQVWMVAVAAGFVSELVLARGAQALFDTVQVVLLWPLMAVCIGFLLAVLCMRLWKVSLFAALVQVATLLPLLFVVPLLQWTEGVLLGVRDEATFVNVGRAVASLLSGGMLPTPVAPSAVAFLWLGVCAWLGWSWWKMTPGRTGRALLRAFLPTYIGFAVLWILPSILGWFALAGHVSLWRVGADVVEHGFVATQIDGYAWSNVYERFPLAIGGEAHISSQWFMTMVPFLVLLSLYLLHLARAWRWSWRQWMVFVGGDRMGRVGGVVLFGLCAALGSGTHLLGWTHALALLALVMSLALFLLAQIADTDLAKAAFGSLGHDRPLSLGTVRSADLVEAVLVWRAGAYVLAWLLGWPVLISFALTDLAHYLSITARSPWAYLGWRALAYGGFCLVGWMVVVERGSFGSLAPALAALVVLVNFGWNWRRNRSGAGSGA